MRKVKAVLLDADDSFKRSNGDARRSLPTVGAFWRWAFSNLADNTVRGVLAEFFVGTALGVSFTEPRGSWDDYDLETPDGIRVKVKATGYLQAWESHNTSPRFSRLVGRKLSEDKAINVGDPQVRCDVFVFCLQTATEPGVYDPLDISQWKFWVMPGREIAEIEQESIGLSVVEKKGEPAEFVDLAEAVKNAASRK